MENGLRKLFALFSIDAFKLDILIISEETVGALYTLPYATEVENDESSV